MNDVYYLVQYYRVARPTAKKLKNYMFALISL